MTGLIERNMKWEPLWENGAPESQFASQDIYVSLDGYDYYAVVFKQTSTADYNDVSIAPVGHGIMMSMNSTSNSDIQRRADYNDKYLHFLAGRYNGSDNNNNAIPIKIYGIRLS